MPVGSVVEGPNRDPFFHNVFSLFEGKRFDLGLYEAGTSREIRFNKPGISYIFCNLTRIAIVIALGTPFLWNLAEIVIPNVPVGRYTLRIWDEGAMSEELNAVRETSASARTLLHWASSTWPRPRAARSARTYGRD